MTNRLLPAHTIVCKQILLEMAAAVARDLGSSDFYVPFRLNSTLSETYVDHKRVLGKIDIAFSHFVTTFQRLILDELLEELHPYPSLIRVLRSRGFLTALGPIVPTPNKPHAPISAHRSRRYPSSFAVGPRIGLSYGTPWHMLAVLHFGCLTYLSNPISVTIYTPDEQLVASKGLISLFKRFPFVKIVDAETHQFSWEDLDLIYDGECLINMYDDCLFSLSEIYGISSDRSHAHSITDYRNPHPLSILTANVITKRLTTEQCNYIKPELSPLYETSRKVVALSNRDPLWAGPGQPWRDTEISTLEPLISKLIHDGYFVVRINTVGKPSSISSPYFLDLATVDITAQDQLNIYKLMSLVIGGVSGVADWPRTFSLLPTLYLNSPVISVSNGFITGLSMVSTQYLRIIDEDVFLKTDTLFLVRLLLNSMWTPEWLASVGLEAQARSSRELLLEASEFLSSVSHQSACLTTHDLLDRFSIHRSHSSIPQPLTTSSHSILANILAAHESI